MLPPATPPLISSTSEPGLLTSKERITIILGGEVKFLSGMGIFFTMYSQITSMLYFNWADIGTTGAPSAIVPCSDETKKRYYQTMKRRHDTCSTITRERW
jgi:hypothetical protein